MYVLVATVTWKTCSNYINKNLAAMKRWGVPAESVVVVLLQQQRGPGSDWASAWSLPQGDGLPMFPPLLLLPCFLAGN